MQGNLLGGTKHGVANKWDFHFDVSCKCVVNIFDVSCKSLQKISFSTEVSVPNSRNKPPKSRHPLPLYSNHTVSASCQVTWSKCMSLLSALFCSSTWSSRQTGQWEGRACGENMGLVGKYSNSLFWESLAESMPPVRWYNHLHHGIICLLSWFFLNLQVEDVWPVAQRHLDVKHMSTLSWLNLKMQLFLCFSDFCPH